MKIIIRGFEISVKPAFFVILMIMIALGMIGQFFVLFIAVSLHECAHILMARAFGVQTQGIVITPVGECAIIRDIERLHIIKRVLVVLAGPAISFIMFIIWGDSFIGEVNLAIALFNMLPIYPLDGGRLLQYIMGYFCGVLRANRLVSSISGVFAYILAGLGFLYMVFYFLNIWWLVIAIYIIKTNRKEYLNMTFQFYKSIIKKSEEKVLPIRSVMANRTMNLKPILYRMGWDYYIVVYVRGENALINEEKILEAIVNKGVNARICDIMLEKSD